MEQLLINGAVPPEGKPLMKLSRKKIREHVRDIKPSRVIALSSHGEPSSFEKVAQILGKEENPVVFIGAYPSGAMDADVMALADGVFSVYPEMLEAWTVTSRLIYEYEKLV